MPQRRPETPVPRSPSVSEFLAHKLGVSHDPSISLQAPPATVAASQMFFTADPATPSIERMDWSNLAPVKTRYQITTLIGHGGMGSVFEAWDHELRRVVAMKVLRSLVIPVGESSKRGPETPQQALALTRFLQEAQILGQLDHPGIVPVHDLGIDASGQLFFIMPLVRGEDLGKVFRRFREGTSGLGLMRVLSMILKACDAVSFAHSRGVLHRDLKPSNIMVGQFGEVYVMDWGLAKVIGGMTHSDALPDAASVENPVPAQARPVPHFETQQGTTMGTPSYMPPEQAAGQLQELGPPSDVYAMGAILYHLLSGEPPYVTPGTAPSSEDIRQRVLQAGPIPVHRLGRQVPLELAAICNKAMARHPTDRYPDTHSMAEDLRAYMEGHVVSAYRTGSMAVLQKWVLRHRLMTVVVAGLLLLVVVTLGSVIRHLGERSTRLERENQALRDQIERWNRPAATPAGPAR